MTPDQDNKTTTAGQDRKTRTEREAGSSLPAASDRCERRLIYAKLLRTEAENKHLGFRDDTPTPLLSASRQVFQLHKGSGHSSAGSDAGWMFHQLKGKTSAKKNT